MAYKRKIFQVCNCLFINQLDAFVSKYTELIVCNFQQ